MDARSFTRPEAKIREQKWFSNSLFNMLVDHYPETPMRPYGSGATEENVLPVLEALKLGFIIIYAKGHSGRTTFYSSLKTEHNMLSKDVIAFYRQATQKTGTKLYLYYSGLLDGIAAYRHPDWAMRNLDGSTVQNFTTPGMDAVCPRSEYFEEWLSVHFREMVASADPDGIWVDGDWPGPCYCPRCLAAFRKETGYDGPLTDRELGKKTSSYANNGSIGGFDEHERGLSIRYEEFWSDTTRRWRDRIAALCIELKPSMLYSSGNICPQLEYSYQCDWKSGDWFSPNNHRLQQSIICRRYGTQHVPFDAMTCDTSFIHSREYLRSRAKPLDRMLQEGAGVLANGGQWCYWTYPMPNGALIPSRMRTAEKAGEFARARRDICLDSDSLKWTAILDATPSQMLQLNAWGAGKAMIHLHRSPDLIDTDALRERHPYELIVAPEQHAINAEAAALLTEFVENGGLLIGTGATLLSPGMPELFGVKRYRKSALAEGHLLTRDGTPAGIHAPWDSLILNGAEVLTPVYRSWDDRNIEVRTVADNWPIHGIMDEENPEPFEHPLVTIHKKGKGKAIYISVPLFEYYWKRGDWQILKWLKELLEEQDMKPTFLTDAPSWVEVSLRTQPGRKLIHVINGNPGRDIAYVNTDDLWADEIPVVGPYGLKVRLSKRPDRARWMPDGVEAPCEWDGEYASFILERLHIHTCLVITE